MMSQKWTKRVIGIMAVVLALVIAGSVLLPVLSVSAATLTAAVIPATGDKIMTLMLSILVVAAIIVVVGILISILKKKKGDGE